jgi:hypothetical protein
MVNTPGSRSADYQIECELALGFHKPRGPAVHSTHKHSANSSKIKQAPDRLLLTLEAVLCSVALRSAHAAEEQTDHEQLDAHIAVTSDEPTTGPDEIAG